MKLHLLIDLMLKVKIEKKKKLNPWDLYNSKERKLKKKYYETQFSNNLLLNDEFFKKKLGC